MRNFILTLRSTNADRRGCLGEMMETTIVERAVQAALDGGATSINADAAQLILNVLSGVRDELQSEVNAHGGTLRHMDAMRAERNALQAWKDAVPVVELQRYHRHMTRAQYGDIDAIQAWITILGNTA